MVAPLYVLAPAAIGLAAVARRAACEKVAPAFGEPTRFRRRVRMVHYVNPADCPELPYLPEQVAAATQEAIVAGVRDVEDVTMYVLSTVYPVDVYGNALCWPCVKSDCASLHVVELQVLAGVRRLLAEHEEHEVQCMLKNEKMGFFHMQGPG